MRRTKIVATIGPSSREPRILERLVEAGVDVLRLNFSHGEQAEHLEVMKTAREIAARRGQPIALLQDLSGPKIRTGKVRGGTPVELRDGARVTITTDETVEGTPELISTSYDPLPRDVAPGDTILLDDGNLELRVLASAGETVTCEVVHGGLLKSSSRPPPSPRRTAATSPSVSGKASTGWPSPSCARPRTWRRRRPSSGPWAARSR
jgi:pyruvate kinase